MDKISELLAEAGPLYRKRRKARQFAAGTLCSLLCGVWFGAAVLLPERAADDILPLDGYGFYEVS